MIIIPEVLGIEAARVWALGCAILGSFLHVHWVELLWQTLRPYLDHGCTRTSLEI